MRTKHIVDPRHDKVHLLPRPDIVVHLQPVDENEIGESRPGVGGFAP